jgi:septal ring-binding cell division protein DamX
MANRNDNPENESENLNEKNNGDDNFGLPELDYKPLESSEETSSTSTYSNEPTETSKEETSQPYSYTPVEEPKSNAPVIIAVIIGLILIVSGFLIYQFVYKPKAEKAKKELMAKQEADRKKKEEEARLAKEKEEAERKRLEAEKVATPVTPAEGAIVTLSERTGRYYVVIHSDLDDDLLMDFAKKLSVQGTSSSIIPPSGKKKFYRLAIGNYDTFADAQANADQMKATYGSGLWVIKY